MSKVIPLQLPKVENLQNLSMFVDAVQNPVKYVQMIDEALDVLQKLRGVVEKTSTVDLAENYLELAKAEREDAEEFAEKLENDFLVSKKVREAELESRVAIAKRAQEDLAVEKSSWERRIQDLKKEEDRISAEKDHIQAQQGHIQAKELELARREEELRKRTDAMKKLVG